LIRRVTLDITGLPPTPEEVDAFLADQAPDAYEKVVDRLLASPAYGERWARHWLDIVGYADSNGFAEADSPRLHAWRYRDYVIRSFNADKPWSDFIVEQLAGDELAGATQTNTQQAVLDPQKRENLIATAFLRMAPDGTGDEVPTWKLARNQVIAEELKVVSSSLLGLTVGCAQCHDHRYDPIPQPTTIGCGRFLNRRTIGRIGVRLFNAFIHSTHPQNTPKPMRLRSRPRLSKSRRMR